jgi:hypothetical protein
MCLTSLNGRFPKWSAVEVNFDPFSKDPNEYLGKIGLRERESNRERETHSHTLTHNHAHTQPSEDKERDIQR